MRVRKRLKWQWFFLSAVLGLLTFLLNDSPIYSAASFSTKEFKLPGGIIDKSSPTLADVDGDGKPEVLVGTTACRGNPCSYDQPTVLVVMKGDGTILWSRNVGAPINSSPAVADIDGDGYPEIVVGLGGDVNDIQHQGGVVAFDRFGNQLWRFYTQDHYPKDGYGDGVFSSPTLCDVNGDGKMEIIFGSWDQHIYVLDYKGNSLWNNKPGNYVGPGYYNADSIWSTAACADLNHDGRKEIIIGADITGGGVLPDGTPTQDGGFLYVFDKDGNVLVRRYLSEAIYAAPAVGDLFGDGKLEIVSGTAWYWWNQHGRTAQPYVYAFDTSHVFDSSLSYSDANKLPFLTGWPQPTEYPGFSSPALADLDGDGKLEIIIGDGDPFGGNDPIPGSGSVYAWRPNGQLLPNWPVHPKDQGGEDAPIFSSPTVADVDGDGTPEVLFSMIWNVFVYGANGSLKARLGTNWTAWASPVVGDTTGNGYPEIWIGASDKSNSSNGYLYRFKSSVAWTGTRNMPWPMFHRDPAHTGRYPTAPALSVTPTSLFALHQYHDSTNESFGLLIRNTGDGSFTWSAKGPSGVTITPSSGPVDTQALATVVVPTTGESLGTHNLGTITISASKGNAAVPGSPVYVPIDLDVVSQLWKLHLPMILR